MVRRSRLAWWLTLTASAAFGQPARAPSTPPLRAADAPPLTESVADGVMELLGAQIDRLGDMATTDFALDPLVTTQLPDGGTPPEVTGDPRIDRATAAFWESCGLDGSPQPVDLRAGSLLPIQIALAARGARAVALVTLGRPGPEHHGMTFPESRFVAFEGQHATVSTAPGFLPDAELLVRDRDAAVISYTRRGPNGEERAPTPQDSPPLGPPAIALTRLDFAGHTLGTSTVLPHSEGLFLDAHPVDWQGGTALVLGRENAPPRDDTRTESVWFIDRRGRPVRDPLVLTTEGLDDASGAPCVALSADTHDSALTAAFTIQRGAHAGLWARRGINLGSAPEAPVLRRLGAQRSTLVRLTQGEGWFSPVASPLGVVVRRNARRLDGDAPLTDVVLAGWPAPRPVVRVFERFWDPLPVWGDGGIVVAGWVPGASPDDTRLEIRWARTDDPTMRPVSLPDRAVDPSGARSPAVFDDIAEMVDFAVAPTASGAIIAWIDGDDAAHRRLTFARVGCRR